MKRFFNIDLVAAEVIKLTRSSYVNNILLYGLFSVVVIIYTYAVHSARVSLRAPACFATFLTAGFVVGMFLPALVGGWLAGHEASSDTWKTLLVRQPTRLPFVVAKLVAGVVVVGGAIAAAGLISLLLFEVTGRALGVMPALDAEQATIGDLLVLVVHSAASGAVAFALALLAKTNSTAIGAAGGIMLQVLLVLLVRWLGAPTRVLARGDMAATSEALPLLGVRAGERWSSIARNFAVITTTVTTIVVAAQVTTPGWLGHVPLALAMALPFAAVNAAVEEGLLRVALIEGVLDVFGPKNTALLSGAVFGGIHYFGVPAGIPGVAMAGFLGWLLARSVIGTRGVGLAWGIHALQDVVIFTMLFATAAAVPT
jgi:hypothetical protein